MGRTAVAVSAVAVGVLSGRGKSAIPAYSRQFGDRWAWEGRSWASRKICAPLSLNLALRNAATQRCGANISDQPLARIDRNIEVDDELWGVLEICTDEELEHVHKILYGGSVLSPVIKSIVGDNEPPAVHLRGRRSLMLRIESRFRFLAADSGAMLRGRRPTYRETLLAVRDRLQVDCPGGLATQDLESEIFLHLLQRQAQAVQEVVDSMDSAKAQIRRRKRNPGELLREKWAEAVETLQLGAPEMGESMLKFASAIGVSSMRRSALQQLGQQLLMQRARYQAALKIVCKGGAPVLQREATLKAAQAGLTSAAARYGTVSGALSMLGPLMWTWLAADLALQSIGTDFQRVTKAVYALAQVRLLRTNGFINPVDL